MAKSLDRRKSFGRVDGAVDGAVDEIVAAAPVVLVRLRLALGLAVGAVAVVNGLNALVLVSWRYDLPLLSGMSGWLLLARENNPSTWLTSALFLVAAAMAAGLAAVASASGDRVQRRGWWLIAGGLALVSLDEAASVHERIAPPLVEGRGVLATLWWVVLLPLAAVAAALLWRFWTTIDRAVRRGIVTAGLIYVTGAAFVESVAQWWRKRQGGQDLTYYAISTVEENLEMLGVLVLCVVLVGAWRRAGGELRLTLHRT